MRKSLSVVVALLSVVLLTSCGLQGLPFLPQGNSDRDQADARMEQIVAAVNAYDTGALKELFSPTALEKATDIDTRLDYFLSFFPNGGLSWTSDSLGAEGSDSYGTELLKVPYKVSADGKDFWLVFADFTVNDLNPDNVGLYALGVTPWAEDRNSGDSGLLFSWVFSMTIDESDEEGYPGIYVPPTISQISVQKLNLILHISNEENKDAAWLRGRFSDYVQVEHPGEVNDEQLDALLALFPEGDVLLQEDSQVEPLVRENTDGGEKQSLLLSTHRVSSGGADYWLSFAFFTENTVDPSKVGFYAIGVAPWTESGDSAAELALFAWADSFDVDASVPPGVFISK